jgi:2-keto-3-deoxy-galactonokinase
MKTPHIRLIATDISRWWADDGFVLVVDGMMKARVGVEKMVFLANALQYSSVFYASNRHAYHFRYTLF